jgi:ribosome-associated translation inhibitor RaiA
MQPNRSLSTIALEIQFRHMPKSNRLRTICRQQIDSFEPLARRGSRCEVVLNQCHSSQHGIVHQATVRLHIPGQRLYVTHTSEFGDSTENLFVAVNNAFNSIRKQMAKTRTKKYCHHLAA